MKLFIKNTLLILILISFKSYGIQSKSNLILQTTRELYISGEAIDFKCTQFNPEPTPTPVLYVDICTESSIISSQILQPLNKHWEGQLPLPDTLQSGIYLLRAYSGNKNGEPLIVSKLIPIVNRFGNNVSNENKKTQPGYTEFVFTTPEPVNEEYISVEGNTRSIPQNGSLKLKLTNDMEQNLSGLSLLVTKSTKQLPQQAIAPYSFDTFHPNAKVKIFPQLYLRGKVSSDGMPLSGEMLILSVPDSIPGIHYAESNADGEFSFWLNDFYGKQDAVIQTLDKSKNIDIEVYPIFLEAPEKIPFYLGGEIENSEFVNLAINRATLHKAYKEESDIIEYQQAEAYPFYGATSFQVIPNDYIALKDFNEIAWEILPIVKYKFDASETTLRLWDPVTKLFYGNPWIIVDGIPVFNPADINVLNSEKIKWIKIQPQIRCYSDLLIEGALVIQTYSGDFSEVEIPKNAIRLSIDTYFKSTRKDATSPLFRDVLSWQPHLSFSGKKEIEIKASYEKGNYTTILELVDSNGEVHRTTYNFSIE